MRGFNRPLLAWVLGVGMAILLIEATLRLLELSLTDAPILAMLAAGEIQQSTLLIAVGLIGLVAGAAGGAVTAVLGRCPLLALPAGLAAGLPLSFTALVGVQPMSWVIALGLMPVMGALASARLVYTLTRLDSVTARS